MRRCLALLATAVMVTGQWYAHADAPKPAVPAALNFTVRSIDGKDVDLQQYQGKVILVVNVASECGLTGQYKPLQRLFDKYKDQGFVVLGFPSNQFGAQEPGTSAEIKAFCTERYNVTFDMFEKIDVNGDKASPLYKHLTAAKTEPAGPGKIAWNFEKFLISRDGRVVKRFAPRTEPSSDEVVKAIEAELARQ